MILKAASHLSPYLVVFGQRLKPSDRGVGLGDDRVEVAGLRCAIDTGNVAVVGLRGEPEQLDVGVSQLGNGPEAPAGA